MPLDNDIKAQIAGDVRAKFKKTALPGKLAAWLSKYVPRFLAGLPTDHFASVRPEEVAALACTAAYGPLSRDAGLPPDDLIDDLIAKNRLKVKLVSVGRGKPRSKAQVDQRALERVLVYGLTRSGGGGLWSQTWPQAGETLRDLVARQIRSPLFWIGQRIFHLQRLDLRDWVRQELSSYSTLISEALILSKCHCWEKWADFRIESVALALFNCHSCHQLAAWDGLGSLDRFLFQVAVKGALRLPQPKRNKHELALVNDFRRGMLAKIVSDPRTGRSLIAGPALRCSDPDCKGQIELNDRCDRCNKTARVKKPSWWVWSRDDRLPRPCHKCKHMDRDGALAEITTWPGGPRKTAALLIMRNGCKPVDVAKELGLKPQSLRWKRMLYEIKEALGRFVCGYLYFDGTGTCPGCKSENESGQRPTEVWVPAAWAQGGELPAGPGTDALGDPEQQQQRLLKTIESWPEGPRKSLAQRVFGDRWALTRIAGELGFASGSKEFKNLIAEVRRAL